MSLCYPRLPLLLHVINVRLIAFVFFHTDESSALTDLSICILIHQDRSKHSSIRISMKEEESEHEDKSTPSVKIMIGFEITAVYVRVCIYDCMQRETRRAALKYKEKEEMYNMLEGDSAHRLSHHYHQWTDEIKKCSARASQSRNNELIDQSWHHSRYNKYVREKIKNQLSRK